jgi:hypothetical protein
MCAAGAVTSSHDTPVLAIIAFCFLVLRRLVDLDLDKRSLECAPISRQRHSMGGKILYFQ